MLFSIEINFKLNFIDLGFSLGIGSTVGDSIFYYKLEQIESKLKRHKNRKYNYFSPRIQLKESPTYLFMYRIFGLVIKLIIL